MNFPDRSAIYRRHIWKSRNFEYLDTSVQSQVQLVHQSQQRKHSVKQCIKPVRSKQ